MQGVVPHMPAEKAALCYSGTLTSFAYANAAVSGPFVKLMQAILLLSFAWSLALKLRRPQFEASAIESTSEMGQQHHHFLARTRCVELHSQRRERRELDHVSCSGAIQILWVPRSSKLL